MADAKKEISKPMDEDKKFIKDNISSLLSHGRVKSKTEEIGGEWKLMEDDIESIHPMPNNIEFSVVFVNEAPRCVRVEAKIHRETSQLSNVKVEVMS